MKHEKNNGAKVVAEEGLSSAERAQVEAFRNGQVSKEVLEGWIRNDLQSAVSLLMSMLHDPEVWRVVADRYYARYVERSVDEVVEK